MYLISAILNLIACGLAELKGLGLAFCRFDFKQPTVLVLIKKGYKFAPDFAFTLANLQELQQAGILTVLKGVTDLVVGTPENDRRTFASTGVMTPTLKHPYMWTFTFDNGLNWFKALTLLQNFRGDLMMFDVVGNALLAKDRQGNGRGLDLLMFDVGSYVIGNENSQTVTVQVNRANFDTSVAWISAENLDFTADTDLDDYNNLDITMVAPSNAATTILFSVYAGDTPKKVPLEGLVVGDLLLQKNVSGTITTVVPSNLAAGVNPGDYILTVAAVATGNIYTLRTNDSAIPSSIINLDGVLYKSNTATTVVV